MQIKTDCKQGLALLALSGKFDFTARSQFEIACQQLLRQAVVKRIHIDFANVDFLDRSGIGQLRLFKAQADAAGKPVALLNCKGLVLTIMQVGHLDQMFKMETPVAPACMEYA
ncbi:STAS domain-containing protein [Leeia oryzae]|uniref:STAS domain-containing protein n=1 Tax=Leeia oryzae TaxID=356662 RepID=UPI0003772503|nr:STAS domain-containing protein [Leeia oryzae]